MAMISGLDWISPEESKALQKLVDKHQGKLQPQPMEQSMVASQDPAGPQELLGPPTSNATVKPTARSPPQSIIEDRSVKAPHSPKTARGRAPETRRGARDALLSIGTALKGADAPSAATLLTYSDLVRELVPHILGPITKFCCFALKQ